MVRGRANPQHHGFAQRLRRARKAADLTHVSLAESAGLVSRSTTVVLERGTSFPRVDTAANLARALAVPASLLAFGVDVAGDSDVTGLPGRLIQARQARGLSRHQLGQRSKTSDTLVRLTETGTTMPNLVKLEALAKALQVSPCWLAFGVGDRELPPRRRLPSVVQAPDPA